MEKFYILIDEIKSGSMKLRQSLHDLPRHLEVFRWSVDDAESIFACIFQYDNSRFS